MGSKISGSFYQIIRLVRCGMQLCPNLTYCTAASVPPANTTLDTTGLGIVGCQATWRDEASLDYCAAQNGERHLQYYLANLAYASLSQQDRKTAPLHCRCASTLDRCLFIPLSDNCPQDSRHQWSCPRSKSAEVHLVYEPMSLTFDVTAHKMSESAINGTK